MRARAPGGKAPITALAALLASLLPARADPPGLALVPVRVEPPAAPGPRLDPPRAALLETLRHAHRLDDRQSRAVALVLAGSDRIGTGNPAVSVHPGSRDDCRRAAAALLAPDPEAEALCGGPHMAPLYDPARQTPDQARACIDRFEFPGVPCELPVVWVRAAEADRLCRAMDKRLCDAHEWEGACAGALEPPDYRFDLAAGVPPARAVARMRAAHNAAAPRSWSYGDAPRDGICATGAGKSPGCDGAGWERCGSNTAPAGSHPDCVSRLGVYDLHGNVAEHMNLPLAPAELASGEPPGRGVTEMKGSWFVFGAFPAHPDWCRWRAPYWHGSRVEDPASHRNYHLGFRCCRTVGD